MHELSIAVGIIGGVLEESERRGGLTVEAVRVRVGRLSGVDKDALLFAYQVAREDTPLAASRLEIEDVEVVIFCPECAQEKAVEPSAGAFCPQCGTLASRVVQGDELEISALEVAA
jgi:hydrogenase nickel incorporation protein HypA/HybF